MSSIGENVHDRLISMLPDEITTHILSLMPTKYAVRTSILSKSWNSWMLITNIDFDDIRPHPFLGFDNFSKFVDRVLDSCKTSQLQSFRLLFSNRRFQKSSVLSWIDKALRLNVCELDIQFDPFELPLSLLTCKTLTKLRIDLEKYTRLVLEYPCAVNLPYLKTLDIVVHNNPLVNVFPLIRGCPMLGSLSLDVCLIWKEEYYISNIPTLKRLKLTLSGEYRNFIRKVVLHVPNLKYLFVGGVLGSVFVMEMCHLWLKHQFSFNSITSDHLCVEFLKEISGVKSLSIDKFPFITSALPIFPNVKHLKLTRYCGLVLQFLESCPELKHLRIEETTGQHWIEPKLVPACMLTNLTTIKISKCWGRKSEMQFLEYMLGNAEVLKTITIAWEIYRIEEEKRLCAHMLEFPRASRGCEIHLIGSKWH